MKSQQSAGSTLEQLVASVQSSTDLVQAMQRRLTSEHEHALLVRYIKKTNKTKKKQKKQKNQTWMIIFCRDRTLQQREEALVAREESVRTRENSSESGLRDVSEERSRIAREITKMDVLRVSERERDYLRRCKKDANIHCRPTWKLKNVDYLNLWIPSDGRYPLLPSFRPLPSSPLPSPPPPFLFFSIRCSMRGTKVCVRRRYSLLSVSRSARLCMRSARCCRRCTVIQQRRTRIHAR